MTKRLGFSLLTVFLFLVLWMIIDSCGREVDAPEGYVTGEEFPGGIASVADVSENAFGNPSSNLNGTHGDEFITGNSFFNRNWVTAPASTTDLDGLGPHFIARSCSGCHFKDGRGKTPEFGEKPVGLLFRLSLPGKAANGAPLPLSNYGTQLSVNSILGVQTEGNVTVSYEEISGKYADGQVYNLRKPIYDFHNLGYGAMPAGFLFSPRVAQQIIGLGLLESISESDLRLFEDINDADGDGISGKVNLVWDVDKATLVMGRFGWKANQPNINQQVNAAFVGDIGITSTMFPTQDCAELQIDCMAAIPGGEPELKQSIADKVALYCATLAVPKRRDWLNDGVLQGKKLFSELKCQKCHIPTFTIENGIIEEFNGLKIWPYTDLLLHDMGQGLADGRPDFDATGTEWRTPPLWGIGLIPTVNKHSELLHDGRARSVEEAILWHGGEAEDSKNRFIQLTEMQRNQLIKFIESL